MILRYSNMTNVAASPLMQRNASRGNNDDGPVVVVSCSSLERPFLRHVIDECLRFSSLVVAVRGTRLFDGTTEDEAWFRTFERHYSRGEHATRVKFVQYDVDPEIAPVTLHNLARWHGYCAFLDASREREGGSWVMFLDGDEIPEGDVFRRWWQEQERTNDVGYKFANHWYFLLPTLRADAMEDSVLMVHSTCLNEDLLRNGERERDSLLSLTRRVERRVVSSAPAGGGGGVMFHHFSWVRSRADLLRKVRSWGHRDDRPWETLLESSWDMMDRLHELPKREFVHGYALRAVPDAFHLFSYFV